jgi:RNA polymerase sigma-70 factor (ECF subfamily)
MAAPDADELALARRCAAGDRAAWDALHRDYAAVVRQAVLAALLRCRGAAQPADVDNLVQKVFLRLLEEGARRLASFEGRSRLATWLSVVAARVTLNSLVGDAEWRADREAPLGDWAEALGDETETAGGVRRALQEEQRRAVGLTLRVLAPRDQLLLRLIYQDGLPYAETARLLGVSPHSIAPLLQRARARFRAAAERQHPDLLKE